MKALSGLLLGALFILACGGGGRGGSSEGVGAEEALRRMVLQPKDLPDYLEQVDQSFTSNEKLAESSPGKAAELQQLLGWGRILGYDATLEPRGEPPAGPAVVGVNSSTSLYQTADGASQSFADARETAESTDWKVTYQDLQEFQQRQIDKGGLADELVWLRFSGFQPRQSGGRSLLVDNLIIFRVDRVRGFLRVLARDQEGQDRDLLVSEVDGWLRQQIQRTEDVLAGGIEQ